MNELLHTSSPFRHQCSPRLGSDSLAYELASISLDAFRCLLTMEGAGNRLEFSSLGSGGSAPQRVGRSASKNEWETEKRRRAAVLLEQGMTFTLRVERLARSDRTSALSSVRTHCSGK